jgi:hypothetical protein
MKTRGRHPTGVLSHRTRRETRSESRSKSPQRRRKATIAENLTSAPSFLKVLPYTKSTTFSAKQVSGFEVPKSSHTCVNSVTPGQMAGLNDRIRIGFEDDFASCTPDAPQERRAKHIPSCNRRLPLMVASVCSHIAGLNTKSQLSSALNLAALNFTRFSLTYHKLTCCL